MVKGYLDAAAGKLRQMWEVSTGVSLVSLAQVRLCVIDTQQNSYSISHLIGTITTLWLDSDCVMTTGNCRQHGDLAAIGSVVTVLPAVVNSSYTVTIQSQSSDCA